MVKILHNHYHARNQEEEQKMFYSFITLEIESTSQNRLVDKPNLKGSYNDFLFYSIYTLNFNDLNYLFLSLHS